MHLFNNTKQCANEKKLAKRFFYLKCFTVNCIDILLTTSSFVRFANNNELGTKIFANCSCVIETKMYDALIFRSINFHWD